MELRQLKLFVAVAEERNFTRAAERCNLTQPSLTRQIQLLEDDLGVPLFDRSRRQIELTAAGAAFLAEVKPLLAQAARAVAVARQVGQQAVTVRVALDDYAMFSCGLLILRAFGQRFPDLTVELVDLDDAAPVREQALLAGTLDLSLYHWTPFHQDRPPFDCELLWPDRLCVLLPEAHPLARLPELPLAALAGEPLVTLSRRTDPPQHAYIMEACRAAGFEPRIAAEQPSFTLTQRLVADGGGVFLIAGLARTLLQPGVVARPLQEEVPVGLAVYWLTGAPPPHLEGFLKVARVVADRYRAGVTEE